MANSFDALLKLEQAAVDGRGSIAAVEGFVKKIGKTVPRQLAAFWSACAGVTLEESYVRFLSIGECLELLENAHFAHCFKSLGMIPIVDIVDTSNYLMIAIAGPLAPRVIYMPHDDGPRVLYRDLDSAFGDITPVAEAEESLDLYLGDTKGDYGPDSKRDAADSASAKALLKLKNENGEWNFAVQLLADDDVEEFKRLLETGHFVRRDVVERMEKMASPEIRQLLRKDAASFSDFAAQVQSAARAAKLAVGEFRNGNLQINGQWNILEAFYYRRNIPNAIPRLLDWIRDQIQKRDPRTRPGNFFADD